MAVERRSFLKLLVAAPVIIGPVIMDGCISPPKAGTQVDESIRRSNLSEFEQMVEQSYADFQKKFESLDPSWTIARCGLYLQDAEKKDFETFEVLIQKAVYNAMGEKTTVDKLRALQKVIEEHRPYEPTLLLLNAVRGPKSDCDTRSELLLDAGERMGLELSLVSVPGHMYVRINHDPTQNWETTVQGGTLFDIQDYLNPVEFNRHEVLMHFAITYAEHVKEQGFEIGRGPAFVKKMADTMAISQFVLENSQDAENQHNALMNLGQICFLNYKNFELSSSLEQAQKYLRQAFEVYPRHHALLSLAKTYPETKEGKRKATAVLSEAMGDLSDKQDALKPIEELNRVLYFKKGMEYDDINIKVVERLLELNPEGRAAEFYSAFLPLLKKSYEANQSSYDIVRNVRS